MAAYSNGRGVNNAAEQFRRLSGLNSLYVTAALLTTVGKELGYEKLTRFY